MNISIKDVRNYVEENIGEFHKKRIEKLRELELKEILSRKNPYLYKAKNILTAQDLVKFFTDAFLSSQEEALFGDFLEGLAIFVCEKTLAGRKSSSDGIDIEFDKNGIRYIMAIKSGPNWGNSSQIRQMRASFLRAKRILRTSGGKKQVVAINGCCYGRDNKPDKGDYMKFCGQKFWEFISGNKDLYTEIIEPLGHKAKERNEEFIGEYSKLINLFTIEFSKDFCSGGVINWRAIVEFNSSITKPSK